MTLGKYKKKPKNNQVKKTLESVTASLGGRPKFELRA